MVIAGIPNAETGGNIANLMFSLCLVFCGVLATPSTLPGFWIFMYRVSPFTYLVSGMLATGLAGQTVTCAANEYLTFQPPSGETCRQYMADYIRTNGGALRAGTEANTSDCEFCTYISTDVFLSQVSSEYSERWRNYGILWAFIIFNGAAAVVIYWLARVPKKAKKDKKKTE